MKEKEVDKTTKKRMLTLFMLAFPTLILAGISGNDWMMITIRILIGIYQIIIIKNFIDEFYGVE